MLASRRSADGHNRPHRNGSLSKLRYSMGLRLIYRLSHRKAQLDANRTISGGNGVNVKEIIHRAAASTVPTPNRSMISGLIASSMRLGTRGSDQSTSASTQVSRTSEGT